jgi:hypothetical protein
MTRATTGVKEYQTLSDALIDTTVPCGDDGRFVQERDQIGTAELNAMKNACTQCPLLSLCHDYAKAARPPAGMWAGRFWGRAERTTA